MTKNTFYPIKRECYAEKKDTKLYVMPMWALLLEIETCQVLRSVRLTLVKNEKYDLTTLLVIGLFIGLAYPT